MRHFSDALIEEFELNTKQTLAEGKLGDVLSKLKKPKKTKQVSIWEDDPLLYDYEGREGSAKCSACGKTFNLKELYVKIHNGSGKWECPHCKGYLEIPNQLEIFSSKFVQCPDCFTIYIKKDYTNVDDPGTCECGGKLNYLITELGRDIPAIKDFALAECESCHTKIPMKDLVINAKKANGKVECQNCPSTKIKIPDRYKSKFYRCRHCDALTLKAGAKNKECPNCPGTLEDYK
jgi:hypothetical protein